MQYKFNYFQETSLDPLGCSLTEDRLGTSLCAPDPLGISILDSTTTTLNTSCESLIPEFEQPMFTSTPRKLHPNQDLQTSFDDVEQFGNVLATPRPIHINSLYMSKCLVFFVII